MTIYIDSDIQYGQGAFEQAMRAQSTIPGRAPRMTPGVAIGVLSAAMRSGLKAKHFDQLIDGSFSHSAGLLRRVYAMYEGCDWDIHLWDRLPNGTYKLATALCRPGQAGWRYDPSEMPLDF